MSNHWKLQAAREIDLEPVRVLLRSFSLPDDDVERHFANFRLAFLGSTLIGCVGLERYGSRGLFRSLAVNKDYRNKGLGAFLTTAMLDHARKMGLMEMYLLTTTAEHFFLRFGFVNIDRKMAPAVIRGTCSFSELCPASAALMRLELK